MSRIYNTGWHTGSQEVNTSYTLITKSNANICHDHLSVLRNRTSNHFMTLDLDPYRSDWWMKLRPKVANFQRFFNTLQVATNQSWIRIRKFLVKDFKASVADPDPGSGAF
jgi:hypothetical protein